VSVRVICLHGPESTGKSTLAAALSSALNAPLVDEYGRLWCEDNGAHTRMVDLVEIATEHQRQIAAARAAAEAAGQSWLILDTDPVMTAVWAQMLYGAQDPVFANLQDPADLYLVPDIDLPWVADGLRYLGAPDTRRRFMDLSLAELDRRTLPYALVQGTGPTRLAAALGAIHEKFPA
jgi:NadR type nicotinamide-nucleotide adenylyltransferase